MTRVTISPLESPLSRYIEIGRSGRIDCLTFDRRLRTVSGRTSGASSARSEVSPDLRRLIAGIHEPANPVEGDVVRIAGPEGLAVSGILHTFPAEVVTWLGDAASACASFPAAPLAPGYVSSAPVSEQRRRWIAERGGKFRELRKIPAGASVLLHEATRVPGRMLPVAGPAMKPMTEARKAGEYVIVDGVVHEWTLYLSQ